MNRYPLWGYLIIAALLIVSALYALPNLFGEQPAVQISSGKSVIKIDETLRNRIDGLLKQNGFADASPILEGNSIRIRAEDTNAQMRIKDALEKTLNADPQNRDYIVALNLISASPAWLTAIGAKPMYLGLDLRGGVHFLLQVDMKATLDKKLDSSIADIRTALRTKRIRYAGLRRDGTRIIVEMAEQAALGQATEIIQQTAPDLTLTPIPGSRPVLSATYSEQARIAVAETALRQNITTLSNRVNELGVSEPVIQQQGADRIVVQLPGVQDTAKAKDIIGRTATLEIRLVDESAGTQALTEGGGLPAGVEVYPDRSDPTREATNIPVKRDVILTGDRLVDAQPGFDENHQPSVSLKLDAVGARIFREVTRENIGKRLAIILFEKGKGEIVTAPVIRSEIPGGNVQISGSMGAEEAKDVALLLRAGSLAAPMEIIEEKTVGPSLGAENIGKGIRATLAGLVIIAVFMICYYHCFGVFSVIALLANVLFLIALLSILQATLTLQGIAAIALTLGIAIDSNVLINERIREEVRLGLSPQMAIYEGYAQAFNTILDSNVTTFIAGLALLLFGTGPIRSFAVVHCLGIVTSLISSVIVSRAAANLFYGSRKNLTSISVGQIWKPSVSAQ